MINYPCPHCTTILHIPDEYAGRTGACNHCRGHITIPLPFTPDPITPAPRRATPEETRLKSIPPPIEVIPTYTFWPKAIAFVLIGLLAIGALGNYTKQATTQAITANTYAPDTATHLDPLPGAPTVIPAQAGTQLFESSARSASASSGPSHNSIPATRARELITYAQNLTTDHPTLTLAKATGPPVTDDYIANTLRVCFTHDSPPAIDAARTVLTAAALASGFTPHDLTLQIITSYPDHGKPAGEGATYPQALDHAAIQLRGAAAAAHRDAISAYATTPQAYIAPPPPRAQPTRRPGTFRPDTGFSDNVNATVYVTRTGKKYHAAGCRYLAQSQRPINLTNARAAGYDACSVCY